MLRASQYLIFRLFKDNYRNFQTGSNIYNVCIREELPKPESEKANAWQKKLGDKKVVQLSGGTTRQIPEVGLQFIRYVKTGKPDAPQPQGSSSVSRLHNFVYIEKASKWWWLLGLRPIATAIKKARIMRNPDYKDKIAIVGEGPKIDLKQLKIVGEGEAPLTPPSESAPRTGDLPPSRPASFISADELYKDVNKSGVKDRVKEEIGTYFSGGPVPALSDLKGPSGSYALHEMFKGLLTDPRSFEGSYYDFLEALLNQAATIAGQDGAPSIDRFLSALYKDLESKQKEKMQTFFERKQTHKGVPQDQSVAVEQWVIGKRWKIKEF